MPIWRQYVLRRNGAWQILPYLYGYGKIIEELLKKSRTLMEYSRFVYLINEALEQSESLPEAIREAVAKAQEEGILTEFLQKYGTEALNKMYGELTKERYGELRELDGIDIGYARGMAQGRAAGIEIGEKRGMAQGRAAGIEIGEKRGMARGISQGISQGAAQEKLKNAKAMKYAGIALPIISNITGLSADEIQKL